MKDGKLSGPAIFMYSTVVIMIAVTLFSFVAYYDGYTDNGAVLWTGIVSFMIVYHFWTRLIMGALSKHWKIMYKHPFFKPLSFEKKLYKILRVRQWRDKVLTFNPDEFLLSKRTLPEIANTMAKAEVDHWVNEIISITAIFFSLIWGVFPIFFITSIMAMLFDAQFIVVQRFNRPKIARLIEGKEKKRQKLEKKQYETNNV
ncbi:MAG: hypothetical protein IKI97_02360 [Clostridia bacterium]|nr:hypothetical protein [Clostridia bacterium]